MDEHIEGAERQTMSLECVVATPARDNGTARDNGNQKLDDLGTVDQGPVV